jgi:hypothetical protein
MTAAERAYAEARKQGLPERVQDPHALDRIAALIASKGKEASR